MQMKRTAFNRYNAGFMVNDNRRAKANKIMRVLNEAFGKREPTVSKDTLLDIGTGNGEIASYLSAVYEVTSVDITDQRKIKNGFKFVKLIDTKLPFADQSFDIVISNHVIEHVKDAENHLSEIKRVLKDNGLVYLATPNRFWPWEVHNKIFFLHYLPKNTFNSVLRNFGRHHEDIFPLTWWELRQRAKRHFSINVVSDRICKWPSRYHMQCHPCLGKLLALIPLNFYRILTFIHPTLIVVLKKSSDLSVR